MAKARLATVWLDGCSGCHMSLLDMDERLLALADQVELVYSPLVDRKEFPAEVDLTLVEGAVSSADDLEKIIRIRAHTRVLVSLGDCATTGNVPSLRNPFPTSTLLERAYTENVTRGGMIPLEMVPALLPRVRPVHEVVAVDVFVPGCPPPADVIYLVLVELLAGRTPDISALTRFGR